MLIFLAGAMTLRAQHHIGNWVHGGSTDTTLVRCMNDTASIIGFPPGCFMGMHMYGDSVYCQFRYLPIDSIPYPIDSTFLCWRRLQIGSDSSNFDFMNCRGSGSGRAMMQFARSIRCHFRIDSSIHAQGRHGWRPTGIKCWNGTSWISMPDVALTDTSLAFNTTTLYSAMAVVGEPGITLGIEESPAASGSVRSDGALPNPFGRATEIRFTLLRSAAVTISIYDNGGRLVETIPMGRLEEGSHATRFDGSSLSTGIYFYRIDAGTTTAIGKAVLTK